MEILSLAKLKNFQDRIYLRHEGGSVPSMVQTLGSIALAIEPSMAQSREIDEAPRICHAIFQFTTLLKRRKSVEGLSGWRTTDPGIDTPSATKRGERQVPDLRNDEQ